MKKIITLILSIVLMLTSLQTSFTAFAYEDNWYSKTMNVEFNKTYTEACDSSDNEYGCNRCDVFKVTVPVKSIVFFNIKSKEEHYFNYTIYDGAYYVYDINDVNNCISEIACYSPSSGYEECPNGVYSSIISFSLDVGTYYIVKTYGGDLGAFRDSYDITFSFKCTKHSYKNTVVAPTYDSQGYTQYICTVCNDSKRDNYKAKLTVPSPKLNKLKNGKKKLTAFWKKVNGVNGYQLQYSTSSKFKKATSVDITSPKTTKRTIKKLKSKKNYYVRIRAYKRVNGKKYYSAWSNKKSIKTK